MKKLIILLLIIGFIFLGIGGYQLLKTHLEQNKSLVEARALLDNENPTTKVNFDTSPQNPLVSMDFNPATGETIGILYIPKLGEELPIIEGTDADELAKGVGHYKGTAFPTQHDQIVLSGHRDTVFRRMGELELGDILTVKLPYGSFSYEIVHTKVVDADDRTVIVPTAPNEVLTVTTCYPFNYIGDAPERYIITAMPISTDNAY
ncbi:class D sortase [Ornithinibacillus contaminans]|uniref:class D sortase n=1 Tax=Ornithinibacillus contaminans TaxID=694055 RepID=UPI00064DCBFD|nr:class D sortase [Ornithinibacillus contaminans]